VSGGDDIGALERHLGHAFGRRELLERALTHKSYANEHPELGRSDNERLEFLGDAVLDLIVGHKLMDRFPALREGELSMMRAQIVSESGLAIIARELDVGSFLFLGKGESQTGGRDKPSLLSDGLEAIIAAVYIDGGFEAARDTIGRLFDEHIAVAAVPGISDFKTRLQERTQAVHKVPPHYTVVAESGPDHDKTFEVAVMMQDRELARAIGKSKNAAESALAAMGDG